MRGTVLVTGAAGALGSDVVVALRARAWRVRALVHRRPVPGADETVAGDVRDERSLSEALERADAVVHLAAQTHARRARAYDEVNAKGTWALVEAARRAGVERVVHASTRAIEPRGGAYSRSKAEAERAVRESGLEFTIIRLPELYGTGGRLGVDGVVRRVCLGRYVPVLGGPGHEVCPIPLTDAVGALVAALESPAASGKTYTLAGECMSMRVFAERCATILGSRSRVVEIPIGVLAFASRLAAFLPLPLYPDQLSRLRAPKPPASPEAEDELGFRATSLEEGVAALRPDGRAAARRA